MSVNWVMGPSIDDDIKWNVVRSSKFVGFLVKLDAPRCVLAVGGKGFIVSSDIKPGKSAGYFYKQTGETDNIEIILVDWLDEPVQSNDAIQDIFFRAGSYLLLKKQDEEERSFLSTSE